MVKEVLEFCKTLKPITDWTKLKKGDKIFHESSLSVEYIDTFENIEIDEEIKIVSYLNYKGEYWNGDANGWYYYK